MKKAILTSDGLNNSDVMAETLKGLTINNTRYYKSDSAKENDTKGDPESNPKVATHTSDGNKRKVTDTSNRDLQQKLLSNLTLPIITMTIEPHIYNRVDTCRWTPHTIATPLTK